MLLELFDFNRPFVDMAAFLRDMQKLDRARQGLDGRHGKWCHLGRVNGRSRLRLALHNDVDSVDGSSLSRFPKTWIPKFIKDCVDLEQEADRLDDLADRLQLMAKE